jgi:ATP-dependent helicase YprA (DUF1998 family)
LSINTGESRGPDADGETPRIFVYDAYPGGIGFSAPLFGMHAELLTRTRDLVAACPCDNGCPSCVGPVGETGPLAKTVALRLLDHLLRGQFRDVREPVAVTAGVDDEVPF